MGGKSDKQTTTQSSNPWDPAVGDLTNILGEARQLYNRGSSYFPGSTVVPFSGQTQQALQGMEQRATAGNPLYGQGQAALSGGLDTLQRTASGQMLNNNPHLSTMFSALSGDVMDAVNSQFSAAGRTASPAHAGVLTKELGNLGAQIYGQDYARERQNQLAAAGQMPGYTSVIPAYNEAGYNDLARLGQVGQAYEGKQGETLQDMLNRFNFEQESPWQNLSRYANIATGIGGMGGSSQGATTVQSGGGLGSILGPIASLAGMAAGPLGGLFGGASPPPASSVASLPMSSVTNHMNTIRPTLSDRGAKTNIEPMDDDKALDAINAIPSFTYRYKPGVGDEGAAGRIGPMAQDWAEEFGGDGKTIPMPQMIGAMFSAIKAIAKRLDALEAKNGIA